MEQTVPIHTLKTQCYQLAQQVSQEHVYLIITKHSKPFVRISPYQLTAKGGLNAFKGTAILKDDLIDPVDTAWDVMMILMYVLNTHVACWAALDSDKLKSQIC